MNETHWTVPHDHPALAGHFPDLPIVPGVVLLDRAIQLIGETEQLAMQQYQISTVKFLSPVQPGEVITFTHEKSARGDVSFNITVGERKVASGKITPLSSTEVKP